LIGFALY